MKKVLLPLLVLSVLSSVAFADSRRSSYNDLPSAAKKFLSSYFGKVKVDRVEKDRDSYEVRLSNGVEIEFERNGQWEKVEARRGGFIPTGFIPRAVLSSIKKEYPRANIVKIEKERGGYDIELDNRMDLEVSSNGRIVKAKRSN